jgi:hypothetical protein
MDIKAGGSGDAVQVTTGAGVSLIIDDCTIQDGTTGIDFPPQGTATSNLLVRNSIISDNNRRRPQLDERRHPDLAQPTAKAVVVIDNVDINHNIYGIRALDNSNVTVRHSVLSQNSGPGSVPSSRRPRPSRYRSSSSTARCPTIAAAAW